MFLSRQSLRARRHNNTIIHHVTNRYSSSSRKSVARRCLSSSPSPAAEAASASATSTDSSSNIRYHDKYPHMFTPLRLKGDNVILSNRVIMGSMHTGLEGNTIPKFMMPFLEPDQQHNDEHPLERMAVYFQQRAKGGAALMVTGGIAPNYAGTVAICASKLTTQNEMEQHKIVTDAVHSVTIPTLLEDNDTMVDIPSKICMQILHTGRYAYHPFPVSSVNTKSPISPFKAKGLSISGIQKTIEDYVRCAVLAKEAGYDGVEIMGSEGYLLSQFFCSHVNKRPIDDPYTGQTITGRSKLALEIVKQTRMAVGDDNFIIIFRLSLLDLLQNGLSIDECVYVSKELEMAGVSIINTGIGWHETRIPTIATCVPRGAFVFPTEILKSKLHEQQNDTFHIPLVATNRINTPSKIEQILSNSGENAPDLISMARPFLADPDFINKARYYNNDGGGESNINTCIACNQACLDHAFIGKTASCLVNPYACHETELIPQLKLKNQQKQKQNDGSTASNNNDSLLLLPKEQRKNIGVIGGGPAGCSFSITAGKQCGHNVYMFEAGNTIGGQFHMAKQIPGKEEFYETIRYFQKQINNHDNNNNIHVQYNTKIDNYNQLQQLTKQYNIDYWIVATGVHPRELSNNDIPGIENATNVLSYIDVLRNKQYVGSKVAIIGAGGIGFDVADYLLHTENNNNENTNDNKDDGESNNSSLSSQSSPADDPTLLDDFYKEWDIDTKLQHRGGVIIPNTKDDDNDNNTTTTTTTTNNNNNKGKDKRQLYLLQRKRSKVGKNLGKTTGWIHRTHLNKNNVQMMNHVQYDLIDNNGNLHITQINDKNKKVTKHILDVDHIILCAGQIKNNTIEQIINQYEDNNNTTTTTKDGDGKQDDGGVLLKHRIYTIGGAYQALELDAKRAIDMGTRLALKIHELGDKRNQQQQKDNNNNNDNDYYYDEMVEKELQSKPGAEEVLYKFLQKWV